MSSLRSGALRPNVRLGAKCLRMLPIRPSGLRRIQIPTSFVSMISLSAFDILIIAFMLLGLLFLGLLGLDLLLRRRRRWRR
jgi:hypothetical protein